MWSIFGTGLAGLTAVEFDAMDVCDVCLCKNETEFNKKKFVRSERLQTERDKGAMKIDSATRGEAMPCRFSSYSDTTVSVTVHSKLHNAVLHRLMLDRLSTILMKLSFSYSFSVHGHLPIVEAHLREYDHSAFGSHWRW